MILYSTPPWYLLQYHQRYSLQCTTYATNATKPAMSSTFHTIHVTHTGTLPKQAFHPRKHATHATHANTPTTTPTLAHYPRKQATHYTQASMNSTPFLKLCKKMFYKRYSTMKFPCCGQNPKQKSLFPQHKLPQTFQENTIKVVFSVTYTQTAEKK